VIGRWRKRNLSVFQRRYINSRRMLRRHFNYLYGRREVKIFYTGYLPGLRRGL
jgi:hypothetical protein